MRYPDLQTAVHTIMQEAHKSSEVQASDTLANPKHLSLFDTVGDRTVFKPLGNCDATDPKVLEWFQDEKNGRNHLVPRVFEQPLADRAFIGKGNISAHGELVKQVGMDEANKIAQRNGLASATDARASGVKPAAQADGKKAGPGDDNPWAVNEKNVDPKSGRYRPSATARMFALARANPAGAAAIAAKAGATLSDCLYPPGGQRRFRVSE